MPDTANIQDTLMIASNAGQDVSNATVRAWLMLGGIMVMIVGFSIWVFRDNKARKDTAAFVRGLQENNRIIHCSYNNKTDLEKLGNLDKSLILAYTDCEKNFIKSYATFKKSDPGIIETNRRVNMLSKIILIQDWYPESHDAEFIFAKSENEHLVELDFGKKGIMRILEKQQ